MIAAVLLLPWVLLMIPVLVLAIASLVVPSRLGVRSTSSMCSTDWCRLPPPSEDRTWTSEAGGRAAKAQCHHLRRTTPVTPWGHPPGTPSANGDATKEHDFVEPPREVAVGAGISTYSRSPPSTSRTTITRPYAVAPA
jgi:hypothetical protein